MCDFLLDSHNIHQSQSWEDCTTTTTTNTDNSICEADKTMFLLKVNTSELQRPKQSVQVRQVKLDGREAARSGWVKTEMELFINRGLLYNPSVLVLSLSRLLHFSLLLETPKTHSLTHTLCVCEHACEHVCAPAFK